MFSISLLSVPLSYPPPPPGPPHSPAFPPPGIPVDFISKADLEYVYFCSHCPHSGHHAALWLVCFALAALWFVLCTVARVICKNVNLIVTARLNVFQGFLLLLALKTKWGTRPVGLHERAPGYLLVILSSLHQIFLTHWLPFILLTSLTLLPQILRCCFLCLECTSTPHPLPV